MSDLLRIKRGMRVDLPELMQGEFGFCLDDEELYIGGVNGNVNITAAKNVYDVRKSGAKGDGITDDTLAIQSLITTIGLNGGGVLYIPKNYIFITDVLNLKSNMIVNGGGTLKFKNDTTAFAFLVLDDLTNVVIEDVIFDGNVANQSAWIEFRHSIQVYGSTNVKIRNCLFKNTIGDCIYISHNGNLVKSENVSVYENSFIGTSVNRDGVTIIHAKNVKVHHNYFYHMGRDTMPGGIDIEPDSVNESVTNVLISDNIIVGGGTPQLQHGVSVNNNVGAIIDAITIANNIFSGVFNYAISCFGNNGDFLKTKVVIIGNTIKLDNFVLAGSAAIIASSRCICDISNNTIDAKTNFGIKLTGAKFRVNGNTIKNSAMEGIEENGGAFDSGTIDGNLIEDCGTNAAGQYGGLHITGSYLDITNNKVLSSETTKSQTGIYLEGGVKNFISGNTFKGMGARAMSINAAPQAFGQNIYDNGFNAITGTYPPIAEAWVEGDMIFLPMAGAPIYLCTVRGTPGTWRTL